MNKPSGQQCDENAKVYERNGIVAYAIWYPQMGGYSGRAVAEINKRTRCIDVYVWHDGEFPFGENEGSPRRVHHCSADQFIEFGEQLKRLATI